jgi:bacterial/archaeal transporter family protein
VSAGWVVPAVGFVVFEGAIGVTIKLALRDVDWRQLLIWTALAYTLLASVLIAGFGETPSLHGAVGWAVASGGFASLSLLAFFIALGRGEASRVVPVSAAYPLVTAVVAALALSEELTPLRIAGTVVVVIGVVILSRD